MLQDVVVVWLDAPEGDCAVCGRDADGGLSVPMFEGDVLPNNWTGEWCGFDACRPCFVVQEALTEPLLADDLANVAYPGAGRLPSAR